MNTEDTWRITNTKSDAPSLGQFNRVFTVSNGYLGLTGNLQEDGNAIVLLLGTDLTPGPWTIEAGSDQDHTDRTDTATCIQDGCHAPSW